jgi:hypothetical protein
MVAGIIDQDVAAVFPLERVAPCLLIIAGMFVSRRPS